MLYVYAVVDAPPRPLGRGLAREPLRAIAHGRLVYIAGELDQTPAPEPARLLSHDAVVRRLARRCPGLLPARFGWTAASAAELKRSLAPHRRVVSEALAQVRGCVQMNVRVFGDTSRPAASPARRRSEARTGTSYLRSRAEAWRASQEMPEIAPLLAELAPLVRAQKLERHASSGILGTAYHLVERRRVRAYRARLARAAREVRAYRLHVTGPWAPYAFAPEALP